MPITPTYPGVYIQEIPSGVHTITGVSTSVTAFAGLAKTGDINVVTRILSFADYERSFGGLVSYSEMSYAVRQFFLNGGSEAWVIRLVGQNTTADSFTLQDGAATPEDVLKVISLTPGESDRNVQVLVDYPSSPADAFILTFISTAKDNPADIITETFSGLSMDRTSANYVMTKVNGASQLVTIDDSVQSSAVSSNTDFAAIRPAPTVDQGSLTSATIQLSDINNLPSAQSNSLRIGLDGSSPDTISLGDTAASGSLASRLGDIAARIQTAVRALKPANPAYQKFTCTVEGGNTLKLTSGTQGTGSSVQVRATANNSIAAALHLVNDATATLPQTHLLAGGAGAKFVAGEEYNLFIADRSKREGIYALEEVDLFNLLCLPGITDVSVLADAAAYCQERRAFLIVDAPHNENPPVLGPNDMYNAIVSTTAGQTIHKTTYGAIYYPWVMVSDPLNAGSLRTCAPCGTIAGLYARIDSSRGVWKAPAGTEASLVGVQGLEYQLTDAENGILNPQGVNCLRVFPAYGPISWGSRTLLGSDVVGSEYKYIPIRRLALYIEESLYRGTKWVVFEPNDEPLWSQIRLNVGAFMHNLFRQGAFQGTTPNQAYFVKCDSETTTQNDRDLGIVNIVVGFAPLKPAEFVIIQIQQIAGQIQV
jgi:phage tail sheath protein FI